MSQKSESRFMLYQLRAALTFRTSCITNATMARGSVSCLQDVQSEMTNRLKLRAVLAGSLDLRDP